LIGDVCIIRLLSENHRTLQTGVYYHPDLHVLHLLGEILTEAQLPADEGIVGMAVQSGEVMLIPTLNPYAPRQAIRKEFPGLAGQLKLYGLLAVPICAHEKTIGTLELVRLSKGNPYDLEDQHIALRIANLMAMAMTNARLFKDLQNLLQSEKTMRLQLIQAEKLSALNRMMATVVHEINNPVQTIKNCIYLAETEAQPGSPQLDYLGMASSEINRITKLVSTLRDIYRQPKTLILEPLDISRLLSDVHMLLEPHLQHQKVAWQELLPADPKWVNAISDHLKQVFLNISLNAIEAMQPDGGTLSISTTTDSSRQEVAVVIADTGCGIQPEDMLKIFEPFHTTKEGGSGLGLYICYEIVRQFKGRIAIESQPGKGSTFTVWLPLVPAPEG
jgi:signal transduction histidine kinase